MDDRDREESRISMTGLRCGFACLFILAGYAPKYLLYSDGRFPRLGIAGDAASYSLEDGRKGTRPIKVAFFNPRGPAVFESPLDSLDSAAIAEQWGRNWSGNGPVWNAVIRIEEAQVGYQVFFFHAEEFGRAKVSIRICQGRAKAAECAGNAELQRRSQKASEKRMKKMFEETLALSVYKCLEAIKPQLDGLKLVPADPGRI